MKKDLRLLSMLVLFVLLGQLSTRAEDSLPEPENETERNWQPWMEQDGKTIYVDEDDIRVDQEERTVILIARIGERDDGRFLYKYYCSGDYGMYSETLEKIAGFKVVNYTDKGKCYEICDVAGLGCN